MSDELDPEATVVEVSPVGAMPDGPSPFVPIPHPSPEQDALADPTVEAVSPTGKPLMPPGVVPYVLIGAVLGVIGQDVGSGGAWNLGRILWLVGKVLLVAITGASPGVRKPN